MLLHCLQGQFKDAFDIVKNTDSLGVPYDYESIMHYPWNAFSSNGKDTMSPIKSTQGKIPYVALSKADAQQVSLMYNCPGKDSSEFSFMFTLIYIHISLKL